MRHGMICDLAIGRILANLVIRLDAFARRQVVRLTPKDLRRFKKI